MSVTSGFYNSLNGDRRYNSEQMSDIFNGIITDGVFANIGDVFAVKANGSMNVSVGVGKCWFNSKWVYNDSEFPLTIEKAEVVLDRIDAVVVEIDTSAAVRNGFIKVVKGTPASTPTNPTLADSEFLHQYPLAYIYVRSGAVNITQANITNAVGTSACPYITAILQTTNIDHIVAQWESQWDNWYAAVTSEAESDVSDKMTQIDSDMARMKTEFDVWFNDIKSVLSDDVAGSLANEIIELQSRFDDLSKDSAVYNDLEDSEGDFIEDSYGGRIVGRTLFGVTPVVPETSDSKRKKYLVTLNTDWSGDNAPFTNTVSVAGITPDDEPFVDIVISDDYELAELEMEAWCYIFKVVTGVDRVTFYAKDKPEIQLKVKMAEI